MGERVCPVCGRRFVPKTGSHTYCRPEHRERARAAARAPGKAAKYGWQHQKVRKELGQAVSTGTMACSRCGEFIAPWDEWDLDHRDDGNGYAGAAHASCNRAAGGAKASWGTIPDPTPENKVRRWSRHWHGPANPRCPRCVELGGPCEDATGAEANVK